MDQSENKDIKDSELTYFGRIALEARREGTHWITRVMIPIAART